MIWEQLQNSPTARKLRGAWAASHRPLAPAMALPFPSRLWAVAGRTDTHRDGDVGRLLRGLLLNSRNLKVCLSRWESQNSQSLTDHYRP